MNFFTSDTHYFHRNIIKYSNRPFSSIEEMTEEMILRWNRVVTPHDTVFHLGDVAFSPDGTQYPIENVLSRLNGKKILIRGNHDHETLRARGWEYVTDYKEVSYDGSNPSYNRKLKVVLFHYPIFSWNKMRHGSIHLHGHTHANIPDTNQMVDVGVDNKLLCNYTPVNMDQILNYIATLPKHVDIYTCAGNNDHHMSGD